MIKTKAFIDAIECFSTDIRKAKRFLNDKRLTNNEKTIIHCFFLLRDNKFEEVIATLSAMTDSLDPIVESQKNSLLGKAYNNQSQFHQAIPYIEKSLSALQGSGLTYFELIGELTLFTIYFNLKNKVQMKKCLDHIKKRSLANPIDKPIYHVSVLHAYFNYYTFCENYTEAEKVLNEMSALRDCMSETEQISHLVSLFRFYVKKEDFVKCQNLLEEMKEFRKFNLTENFNFMKKLLDHYTDDKPIYFQDQAFKHKPVLFHQLKVIQCLEAQDMDGAHEMWLRLAKIYPDDYQRDFNYHGEKNIFSLCLKKHLAIEVPDEVQDIELILKNANGPIKKEILFRAIYGREPEDKMDLLRLSKDLYRLRLKHNLELKSRKGCYIITKKAA